MITLKNKLRRMRTFNLDAPFFVKRHGETLYGRPETLTLLALERRENLDDALLACTEVKTAIESGNLRVYKQPEPAPEPVVEEVQPEPEPELEPEMPPLPDLEPDDELIELDQVGPEAVAPDEDPVAEVEPVPEAGPDAENSEDDPTSVGWEHELESQPEPEDED